MPPRAVSVTAPAKINLMLHIVGRRPDGYHELQTLFQLLSWGDRMTFSPVINGARGPVSLTDNSDIPSADNLVTRAALTLLADRPAPFPVHIDLDKRIPAGGGLGGGSSDAAATLLVLNDMWSLGHSLDELAALGARLGADIPVFVRGRSAWAEGIGERLVPVDLPDQWFVIAHPGIEVSTGRVFAEPGLTRNSQITTIRSALKGGGRNDCEPVVRQLYPAVDTMLNVLESFGTARLTGTGACGFVALPTEEAALAAARSISDRHTCHVARASNHSPVFNALARRPGSPSNSA